MADSAGLAFLLWAVPFVVVLVANIVAFCFKHVGSFSNKTASTDEQEPGSQSRAQHDGDVEADGTMTKFDLSNGHVTSTTTNHNFPDSHHRNAEEGPTEEEWNYHVSPSDGITRELISMLKHRTLSSGVVTSAFAMDEKMLRVMNMTTFQDWKTVNLDKKGRSPHEMIAKCKQEGLKYETNMSVVPIEQFSHIDATLRQDVVTVEHTLQDSNNNSSPEAKTQKLFLRPSFLYMAASIAALALTTAVPLLGMFIPLKMKSVKLGDDFALDMDVSRRAVRDLFLVAFFAFLCDFAVVTTNAYKVLTDKSLEPWKKSVFNARSYFLMFSLLPLALCAGMVGLAYNKSRSGEDDSSSDGVDGSEGAWAELMCRCHDSSDGKNSFSGETRSPSPSRAPSEASYQSEFVCTADEYSSANGNICAMSCGVCSDDFRALYISFMLFYWLFFAPYIFLFLTQLKINLSNGSLFVKTKKRIDKIVLQFQTVRVYGPKSFGYPVSINMDMDQWDDFSRNVYKHRKHFPEQMNRIQTQ